MMKAWVIQEFGGSEVMKIQEMPKPATDKNEVLIKIAYTAVNPVDWKIREGLIKDLLPHTFPIIPGWDLAGTIAEVGPLVKQFKLGDKVFAFARKPTVQWGTYAEYAVLDCRAVAKKPESIELQEAAAVPLTSLTAYQALFDFCGLKAGEIVFINGGAGGVGSFAIQLAKQAGATVIASASPQNHDYVRALGADLAINHHEADAGSKAKRLAKDDADVVFDCVGGSAMQLSWEMAKKGGRLVGISEPPNAEKAKELQLKAGFVFVEPNGVQLAHIAQLFDLGRLRLPAIKEFSIREAPAALAANQAGHTRGKVVMKIDF